MTEPLFRRSSDRSFAPTPYTRGPWDPTTLHGGPVAALFAETLQDELATDAQPARLTVDLVRPVPLAPLELTTVVVRDGRRLQVVTGTLTASAKTVATATLAAVRTVDVDVSGLNPDLAPPPDGPEDADGSWQAPPTSESFVGGSMDFSFVRVGGIGHGIAWLRLRRQVLDDRPISPLARAAAAGDVGGAVSSRRGETMPPVSFPNADLSVSLSRPPEGEWLRMEADSRWEANGVGWALSRMSDHRGEVGAVSNALVLEPVAAGFGPLQAG